jgi:hypothetical protein
MAAARLPKGWSMMKILAVIILMALAAADAGCRQSKSDSSGEPKKIGGCDIETIKIGTGTRGAEEAPADAAWIRVSSVKFGGNDLYKKVTRDLANTLASHDVTVYSCSELVHVKNGSCWPPYAVELRINMPEEKAERFRRVLLETPLADHSPTLERPEDYGPFYIACGTGATDWWTVWYIK